MAAYVAPVELPPEVTTMSSYQRGVKACALAYPFIKSLNREWSEIQGVRVYFGMKKSAILCSIKDLYPYMTEPLTDPSYQCPASKIPYTFPDWNQKFLSPVCRDWFIDQEATPQHTIISDRYVSANARENAGAYELASCAPVFE